jgi:putative tryptophan/tyrosine transport system substrate-binding protein
MRMVISAARNSKLPAIFSSDEFVKAGGLIGYGPSLQDIFRRAARHVDRVLRGAKPNDLPVELPIKFNLSINLKTAKTLGLTIPETLLATADEVIQ